MRKRSVFKAAIAGMSLGALTIIFYLPLILSNNGHASILLSSALFPLAEPTFDHFAGLPATLLLLTLPVAINGGELASDLKHSAPYRMIRQKNRSKWYVHTVCLMVVAAFVYATAYALIIWGALSLLCMEINQTDDIPRMAQMVAMFVTSTGLCVSLLMLFSSLLAVSWTQGGALALTVGTELLLTIFALAVAGNRTSVGKVLFGLNPMTTGMASWHDWSGMAFEVAPAAHGLRHWMSGLIAFAEWCAIAIAGWLRIYRMDLI